MTDEGVTVVMPVFNGERWVRDAVGSVLEQVVAPLEILVVDDGSTDGTSDFLKKRHDVILLKHPVNRGYGAALISAFARFVHTTITRTNRICIAVHRDLIPRRWLQGNLYPYTIFLFGDADNLLKQWFTGTGGQITYIIR